MKIAARAGALALTVSLGSGLAGATQFQVTLQAEGAKPASPVAVALSFRQRSVAPKNGTPVPPQTMEVPAELPGVRTVDLPPGEWELVAKAAGYWARSTQVDPQDTKAELTFFPSSSVLGTLGIPPGEAMPKEVTLRFSSAAGSSSRRFRNTEVTCSVAKGVEGTEGAFQCDLPAGQLDLRVRARGFISHYRWGEHLETGKPLSLGSLKLRRGASVSGWVVTSNGTRLGPSCQATLAPRVAGLARTATDLERSGKIALSTAIQPSGFFHFEGVPVGSYVLAVQHPGFATARLYPVQVLENAESEIRQPLLLQPETTLAVFLDPATDSRGERWKLDLEAAGPMPGSHEQTAEGTAELDGSWRRSGLAPGHYLLLVGHLPYSILEAKELEIEPQGTILQLTLPFVWVEGEVRLGGKPLASTLWFGGRYGKVHVRVDTDAKGRFTDTLPHDGEWPLDVEAEERDVQRHLRSVKVRRSDGQKTARLEIDLPDTKLAGKVIDEQGRPAPETTVTLLRAEQLESPASVLTDTKGIFHFAGLPPDHYHLQAQRASSEAAQVRETSEVVDVDVAEDRAGKEPVLVLLKNRVVSGRIMTNGEGVPQARLQVVPRLADGSHPMFGPSAISDVEGRFRLELPARTASLDVLVMPPGFAMRLLHVGLSERDEPLAIPVEPGGGTLVVETEDAGGKDSGDPPILMISKDGVGAASGLLTTWARIQGRSQEPGKLIAPALEPGVYEVCLTRLVGFTRSTSTDRSPRKSCVSGSVPAAGELRLKLKAETPPAPPAH